jgi:CheY-like chemotaxis protein
MRASTIKTILIIDDSRVSRMFARQYILALHPDWLIEEADSGEQALARLAVTPIHLILLDVNMPGIGGLATAVQLRELHAHIPVCIISANIQNATRDKALALGAQFIEKPITQLRIAQALALVEDA